ncbi:FecR family protein [Butyricimonas paravirosa]|uniref:FecR family protein n=1 Tax=Butyricimonas paravirosa TaxID=1472417 RepID=UPI00210C1192|nr:FecR family protein [Butyricimonas paravirosa]MCQ4872106.1 DUF4974 domain-containing protein [Butyricimonas paravirosa]
MQKEIHELITAYLRNELSGKESDVLREWMEENENHRRLVEELRDKKVVWDDVRLFASFDTGKRWKQLVVEMGQQKAKKRSLSRKLVAYAATAAVLLLAGIIGLLQPKEDGVKIAEVVPVTIYPGETRAVLMLEDGNLLPLMGMKDTTIVVGERERLVIDESGNLKYLLTENSRVPSFHTLRVPRGGEYKLMLDDGTEVWMNSASELRYPVHFTGDTRRVELVGEAYFQVAHDQEHPFVVVTRDMDVRVLGTSFNVSAYPDESAVTTTLVEGRVELNAEGLEQAVRLSPGEQGVWANYRMDVRQVNTKLYTSWIKDRFSFESEGLETVLRRLARWYNVDFRIENPGMKEKIFSGTIPKYEDISKVLKIMEMTTNISFEVKDGVVIIR